MVTNQIHPTKKKPGTETGVTLAGLVQGGETRGGLTPKRNVAHFTYSAKRYGNGGIIFI